MYNPRYVTWAKKHGLTPEEMLEKDKADWPGGCMCGFSLWIQEEERALLSSYGIKTSDLRLLSYYVSDIHKTFDEWLEKSILKV